MAKPILNIDALSISYFTRAGEIPVVMDFSLTLHAGESIGLVGESGCGKSTVALGIMRDLPGTGRITGGQISFQGRDMGEFSAEELRQIRGSKIAMIYQEPMASLNPSMKVGRQLTEVPMIHEKLSFAKAKTRVLEMLSAVKLPDPQRLFDSYPHQLSGGQQQRAVIAMALLSKPDLLILDEPTTALDVTIEAGIVTLVKELGREFGTAMLFISHNLGLILDTCDRVAVMYSGEAVESGPAVQIFDHMRHPYTQGLLRSIPLPAADKNIRPLVAMPGQLPLPHERPYGCNFAPRCDYFLAGQCDGEEKIPMQEVGGEKGHFTRCVRENEIDWDAPLKAQSATEPIKPGKTILEIDNLKKYYGLAHSDISSGSARASVKANESVYLRAREAETVAIVGESGCGKSTLAKIILGLETATEGSIKISSLDIANIPIGERRVETISAIQMVFQNPFDTLNPSHSVGAQIIRTLEKFNIGKNNEERRTRMMELLDLVKLPADFVHRMPRQLSGGQKQRIGVARAFAGNPKLVVADEPVSALDVSVQAAVTELLMDIQRRSRTTLLFISHDLSVVRYIADHVVVMYLGHVVEQGPTEQVFSPPYHPYTESLLCCVPIADTKVKRKRIVLEGDIPSALSPPTGCPFQTRCPRKSQIPNLLCETDIPTQRQVGPNHEIKCHLDDGQLAEMEPVITLS